MWQIKFRAWDNQRNIMIWTDYWNNRDDETDEWYAQIDYMRLTSIQYMSYDERYNIMQLTWLKDKNWKEIYIWDIVIWQWSVVCEVKFDGIDCCLYYEWLNWEHKWFRFEQFDWNNIYNEIIGNIYENKDLF